MSGSIGGNNLDPLISIIVPVHNVEKYLHRCVDSMINQTYQNLEILLVDDGSTDHSPIICKEYAKKDDRVVVIHQKNSGATVARKTGIAQAKGDYIGFVDSDDWVDCGMYRHMMDKMSLHDVDFVQVRHFIEYATQSIPLEIGEEGIYHRTGIGEKCSYSHMFVWDKKNKKKLTTLLWDKLFKKEVILKYHQNLLDTIVYAEDAVCIYTALPFLDAIYISNHHCYHYNQENVQSISKTLGKNHTRVDDAMNIYLYLSNAYQIHEAKENLLEQLYAYLMKLLLLVSPLPPEKSLSAYLFPYENIMQYKKIIIYGAGKVGISYYKQLIDINNFEVVGVIDKTIAGQKLGELQIDSLELLTQKSFDILIIAIDKEALAFAIQKELQTAYAIPSNKIIWKKPRHIFDIT